MREDTAAATTTFRIVVVSRLRAVSDFPRTGLVDDDIASFHDLFQALGSRSRWFRSVSLSEVGLKNEKKKNMQSPVIGRRTVASADGGAY